MNRVEESNHFSRLLDLGAKIRGIVASTPGVRSITEREFSGLEPILADHYADEFKVTSENGNVVAFIDIHHIGNTGLKVIFPTIIRLNEISGEQHQTDIFSIDNNGHVLVHTNIRGEGRTESKDTSLERLMPYETEILERAERFPLTPRMRLKDAFYLYKSSASK